MYNVNLTTLAKWLLPSFLRGKTLIALLRMLVVPLQKLYQLLDAFRSDKQFELSITSQVIWLEKMLNKYFDPLIAGIYIVDVGAVNQVYVANKSEIPHPRYLYNKSDIAYVNAQKTILYNKNEGVFAYNFTVMVPNALYQELLLNNQNGLNRMKAKLNQYKLFGTIYNIQPY